MFDIAKIVEKTAETADAYGDSQADKYKISDTQNAPWENDTTEVNRKDGKDNANNPFTISKSPEPPWEYKERGDLIEPERKDGKDNANPFTISQSREPPWEQKEYGDLRLDSRIASVDKAQENKDGIESDPHEIKHLNCRNEDLAGKQHPETGVPFVKKTVKDADGNDIEVVVPVFDSSLDAQLPENLYQASDAKQFAECNKQLKEAIEKDPELAKKFTPEQLEQIKNGDTPDGYTWHHNEEAGKIQLVDSEIHEKTHHTGGRAIWGGGEKCR